MRKILGHHGIHPRISEAHANLFDTDLSVTVQIPGADFPNEMALQHGFFPPEGEEVNLRLGLKVGSSVTYFLTMRPDLFYREDGIVTILGYMTHLAIQEIFPSGSKNPEPKKYYVAAQFSAIRKEGVALLYPEIVAAIEEHVGLKFQTKAEAA